MPHRGKPGRGPGRLNQIYLVTTTDEFPFEGRFAGVVLGVTKEADTLIFQPPGSTHPVRFVRYEHLESTQRLGVCSECGELRLVRNDARDWQCLECGHTTDIDPSPMGPAERRRFREFRTRPAQ